MLDPALSVTGGKPRLEPAAVVSNDADSKARAPSVSRDCRDLYSDYQQTEKALRLVPNHYLNDVANFGFFKPKRAATTGQSGLQSAPPELVPVYTCLNVYDIRDINPVTESFTARVRLYCVWQLDLKAADLAGMLQLAAQSDHYYSLNDREVKEFEEKVAIPFVNSPFFNAIDCMALDPSNCYRVYAAHGGAVMFNQGYLVTCREHFELENFPFDKQDLTMELRLDNPRSWDGFDLCVHSVQFYRTAVEMSEWHLCQPIVKRGAPSPKASNVNLQVVRKPHYYVRNIVCVMLMLALLSLLVFAIPEEELADKISVCLTLLLTTVAFKFVIGDSLPRVNYDHFMDSFIFNNMFFLSLTALTTTVVTLLHRLEVEDVFDISNNSSMLIVTIMLFFVINARWSIKVLILSSTNSYRTPVIDTIEGKNWYNCWFGNPYFMPPLVSNVTDSPVAAATTGLTYVAATGSSAAV
jgi:hypothetical protein